MLFFIDTSDNKGAIKYGFTSSGKLSIIFLQVSIYSALRVVKKTLSPSFILFESFGAYNLEIKPGSSFSFSFSCNKL